MWSDLTARLEQVAADALTESVNTFAERLNPSSAGQLKKQEAANALVQMWKTGNECDESATVFCTTADYHLILNQAGFGGLHSGMLISLS